MPALTVVANPTSRGSAGAVEDVLRAAAARGWDARVARTTMAETGEAQARRALAAGDAAVVAIGGDGTVRAVATALAGTGVPLGIVPRGTANLFARNLGLPLAASAAVATAVAGEHRAVDLGTCVLHRADGRADAQRFLVVVGVGHDALAIEAASLRRKHRLGWPAYVAAGLGRLRLPGFRVHGVLDDESATAEAWSVLVHNAAGLPAGLRVVPGTSVDDGLLHVVTVTPRRVQDWARIAASGAGLGRADGVLGTRAVRRALLAPVGAEPLPVQVDGDAEGRAVRIEAAVEPGVLLVRAPGRRPAATGRIESRR